MSESFKTIQIDEDMLPLDDIKENNPDIYRALKQLRSLTNSERNSVSRTFGTFRDDISKLKNAVEDLEEYKEKYEQSQKDKKEDKKAAIANLIAVVAVIVSVLSMLA